MEKTSSKLSENEGWISFETINQEIFLSQEEIDELVLDTYKWVLKLNVQKLKNNNVYMKRLKKAKERKNKNV